MRDSVRFPICPSPRTFASSRLPKTSMLRNSSRNRELKLSMYDAFCHGLLAQNKVLKSLHGYLVLHGMDHYLSECIEISQLLPSGFT